VPKHVIDELFNAVYGGDLPAGQGTAKRGAGAASTGSSKGPLRVVPPSSGTGGTGAPPPGASGAGAPAKRGDNYAIAHLREKLASDPRCHELDIQIDYQDGRFLLRGETTTAERRQAMADIVHESFPDVAVENQIRLTPTPEPQEAEEFK
jgi:hypothetical protein